MRPMRRAFDALADGQRSLGEEGVGGVRQRVYDAQLFPAEHFLGLTPRHLGEEANRQAVGEDGEAFT